MLQCGKQLGECVCNIKVRFTSMILLTKTHVPLCFIVNGNELKQRQNFSWHDFASSYTNERDFRIVLYRMIQCDTQHMGGFFWVLRVGNFAGVLFASLLARIANDSLKQVQTGGIPHSLVTLGLCYVTYQPIRLCFSLKNAASAKGFVSKSAFLIFSWTIVNFNMSLFEMTAEMMIF